MDHFLSDDQPLDFDDFANQMLNEGADQSPAYLHGGVCGVYAGAGAVAADHCLAAVSQALELGLHGELADSCLRLADITLRAMQDEEFDFHLFLPDDETELDLRVMAVADWSRGFLAAYTLLVTQDGSAGLDEETREVLKDVAAIAEASADTDTDTDSDPDDVESHLFELTEYLRFASLNLFMNRLLAAEDAEGEKSP